MSGQIKKITVNGTTYDVGGGISAPISTTYAELKSLKNSNGLAIGQKYRITDFVSMFNAVAITSANHPFDLIIEANANNSFSETAIAIHHVGDDYFANQNLSAWQVSYCFDNDTDRFPKASSTGKGFIYYLKDEYGNEACYDFKNALFELSRAEYDFISSTVYAYTFSTYITDMSSMLDASLNANSVKVKNNVIKEFNKTVFLAKKPSPLSNSISNNTVMSGKVVVYATAAFGVLITNNTFSPTTFVAKVNNQFQKLTIKGSSLGKIYSSSQISNSEFNFIKESRIDTNSKIENSNLTLAGMLQLTLSSSPLNLDTVMFFNSGLEQVTCTISNQTFGAKNIKINTDGSFKAVDPFA